MKTTLRHPPSRPVHQTGGISVLAALTLVLAVMFTGLALDTARLWLAKRELQRSVDMAALAAARHTGCGSTSLQAAQAAQNAGTQNGLPAGYTMLVQRGVASVDTLTRYNTFTLQDSELSNAAQVTVTAQVPASIMAGGLLDNTTTTLRATATAKGGPPVATFSIGSFASISQNQANFINALFRGILGNSSVNLGVAALADLGGTSVNLAALQVAAGAATIDELLNRQVPIGQLLQWLATSSPSANAATSLSQLGTLSLNSGLTVRLRDVLNVQIPANSAVATVDINVLDLVQTSLLVGKGKGTINLGLNIAGVGGISLNLLNPPKIAVGPAGKSLSGAWCTATQSAQMSLKVGLNPLGIGLVDMALFLDLLSTSGHLASLNISPGNNTGRLEVGSTLIGLRLRNNADSNLASVFGGLVQLGLNLPIGQAAAGGAPFMVVSDADLPRTVQTSGVGGGTISGLIGKDTSLTVKFLGLGLDLLSPVVKLVVSPLLSLVGDGIIDPLLQALGFDIGLVRVRLVDIDSAKPVLIL